MYLFYESAVTFSWSFQTRIISTTVITNAEAITFDGTPDILRPGTVNVNVEPRDAGNWKQLRAGKAGAGGKGGRRPVPVFSVVFETLRCDSSEKEKDRAKGFQN